MNGTQLTEQINWINEIEQKQYTNIQEFCIYANLYREKVFANEYWRIETPKLPEKVKIFENKIKENIFDEQAVQIAKEIYYWLKFGFYYQINSSMTEYKQKVGSQIFKYRWSARTLKITQQVLQLAVIIGAVSVPLILSNPDSPREISTIISIIVAASAALIQFYKFQDHINFNHTAAEKMQLEYSHYLTDRGVYADLSAGEALDRFMDEIDKLRQENNELSLSLEKSTQDQKLDQIQNFSKSILEIHQVKDAK